MIKDRNLVLNFFDWGNLVNYIEEHGELKDSLKSIYDLDLTTLGDMVSAIKTNLVTPQEIKYQLGMTTDNFKRLIISKHLDSDIPLIGYVSDLTVNTHTCFLLNYLKSKGIECSLYTDYDLLPNIEVNLGDIVRTDIQLNTSLLQLYLQSLGYNDSSNPLANNIFHHGLNELCSYRPNEKDLYCYISNRSGSLKKFSKDYPYTSILSPQLIQLAILEEASKRNYNLNNVDSEIGDWALRLDKSVDIALDVLLCVIHGEELAGYFSLNLDS